MQKPVSPLDAQPAVGRREDEDEIDLLGLARTLWRGKHWIALCATLALSYGWYKANVASTALFTATAEMALEVDSAPVLDINAVVSGFSGDEASINTEMAIVRSGDLIGRLVDELHLEQDPEFNAYLPDPDYSPGLITRLRGTISEALRGSEQDEGAESLPSPQEQRQELIDAVRGAFETESSWDTYVFSISATTTDPVKSQLLANTLAELYRDDQIRLKVQATERAATWLSGRVGELRAELDERQNEISDLRARSALVSAESLQALNAQAIELRTTLQQVQGQLVQIDERAAELRAAASGDTEAKLAAADDGQLEAAAAELAASEPGAQIRFDRRYSQLLLQTEAERERAQKQIEELQRTVEDLSGQFEGQSADFQALQQLEQEAEATQVLYETFLNRLKETTVQESIHESDSRILTEARVGEQVAPRSSRIMAMALLLGLLLGAGIVLLREFLQNTIRTAEDLEQHTGRTVLGQFPRIPARSRPDTIEYLLNKPTSAAAEAIRNLRTSLLLSNVDRPPQVIMATSSVPNEGKTTLTIALAQNLAGLNKRVLLIEGDIRRRTFQAYFSQAKGQHGLLSVIAGRSALSEAVVRPDNLGIDVLLGEERSAINAADLFSSESFKRLIEMARAQYDYIVIDTPPVLVVPDARVIAQQTDAVIYVVHWDHTTKSQVEEGLRQFRSVNLPVTGLVLSRVDPKGMKRYGYGGRYGAYSRYGRSYYDN
ncbi:polysaccharide biosynthesis tyrosine autokinase [Rubellimicrobium roseum]|nr:polysaccharide biosynthesis tyrosine autokinase [Rubellimicrobium roseum]